MNGPFANLPSPPYYAVIFSSTRTAGENGYDAMADRMVELAAEQAGFLGVESARGADGFGINGVVLGQTGCHHGMEGARGTSHRAGDRQDTLVPELRAARRAGRTSLR